VADALPDGEADVDVRGDADALLDADADVLGEADVAVDADALGEVDAALGEADAADDVVALPDAPLPADGDAPPPPPHAAKIGRINTSNNAVIRCVRDIFIDS